MLPPPGRHCTRCFVSLRIESGVSVDRGDWEDDSNGFKPAKKTTLDLFFVFAPQYHSNDRYRSFTNFFECFGLKGINCAKKNSSSLKPLPGL